jgi:hypothetical protein
VQAAARLPETRRKGAVDVHRHRITLEEKELTQSARKLLLYLLTAGDCLKTVCGSEIPRLELLGDDLFDALSLTTP